MKLKCQSNWKTNNKIYVTKHVRTAGRRLAYVQPPSASRSHARAHTDRWFAIESILIFDLILNHFDCSGPKQIKPIEYAHPIAITNPFACFHSLLFTFCVQLSHLHNISPKNVVWSKYRFAFRTRNEIRRVAVFFSFDFHLVEIASRAVIDLRRILYVTVEGQPVIVGVRIARTNLHTVLFRHSHTRTRTRAPSQQTRRVLMQSIQQKVHSTATQAFNDRKQF